MSEESLREFFAQCKLYLHVNLGFYCDRNNINRTEFSLFMNGRRHHLDLMQLKLMRKDLLNHIRLTLNSLEKIV